MNLEQILNYRPLYTLLQRYEISRYRKSGSLPEAGTAGAYKFQHAAL